MRTWLLVLKLEVLSSCEKEGDRRGAGAVSRLSYLRIRELAKGLPQVGGLVERSGGFHCDDA